MSNENDNLDNLNTKELKALLLTKNRIEAYLRAEVKDLWLEINELNSLPLINVYRKLVKKFKYLIKNQSTPIDTIQVVDNQFINIDTQLKNQDFDVIFLLPTNNLELGGISLANSLAQNLSLRNLHVGIIGISHDPSTNKNPLLINPEVIKSVSNIVVCGAETISLAKELQLKFNSRIQLFIQGLDFLFTPNWNDAKEFLSIINEANSIVCISPFLEKAISNLGGKNIQLVKMGPDSNIFKFNNLNREKILLVPCRIGQSKGLRVVLSILPLLKSLGFKIIGFGDLEDINQVNYFDDFVGRLSKERLSDLLNISELILDPSSLEGLGLISLEAAHCGCIPIVQKRDSYQDLFEKNKKPFIEVSNFLNPAEVTEAIKIAKQTLTSEMVRERVKNITFQNGFNEYVNKKLYL